MRPIIRSLLSVAVLAISCLVPCALADLPGGQRTVITVAPDGTGDYPTIQAAVDAAEEGDTIELTDGVFMGDGNQDIYINGKTVTVRSQSGDPSACVVMRDPGGFMDACWMLDNVAGPLEIRNLTLREFKSVFGGGIYCSRVNALLDGIVFDECRADVEGGGMLCELGHVEIRNCTFRQCRALDEEGGGISCGTGAQVEIRNTIFVGCRAMRGGALLADSDAQIALDQCTFVGNGVIDCWNPCFEATSLLISQGTVVTATNTIIAFGQEGVPVAGPIEMTCCDVYGNEDGDWIGSIAGQYGINGNICEDPLFCDRPAEDFHIYDASPCAPFTAPNPECDLIGALGIGCWVPADVLEDDSGENHRLVLHPVSPVSAEQGARLDFSVPGPQPSLVTLEIRDIQGRTVRTVLKRELSPGSHTALWDGLTSNGRPAAAGCYFGHLSAGEETCSRSMLVVK